jgi:hypothetical protein
MEDLDMQWISAKFVSQLLTNKQKQQHMFVCQETLDGVRNSKNFLSRFLTGDETQVHCYDPQTKQQSSQWKSPSSPCPKKATEVRLNMKSMLVIFLTVRIIIHKKFVPPGQTLNQNFTRRF